MSTVAKPPIQFIGTNGQNIWAGKGAQKAAIVLHIMQGSLLGCDQWFSNPAAEASANFGVGLDGTIHCYVDPHGPDAPFANGIVALPDAQFAAWYAAHPGNPNYRTISIEHEGFAGTPTLLTPAQLHASAWLTAWLTQEFSIPFDEDHLYGHFEIDSVTRAHCPGLDRAGFTAYEAAVNAFLAAPANPDAADLEAIRLSVLRIEGRHGITPTARPDAFHKGAPGAP